MVQVNKEQMYDIAQFVKFLPDDRVKTDVQDLRTFLVEA